VGRWEPGTADRLRLAALELFVEQGYEATTIDDIAERVDVTQRTFFRHFADKEEVLFDEDDSMRQILLAAVAAHACEHGAGPGTGLAAARAATAALARSFERERERHRARWEVLTNVPALQGRQLVKQERWVRALRNALIDGGVPRSEAAVAVEIASAAIRLAYAEWLTPKRPRRLLPLLRATDEKFDLLLGGTPTTPATAH
jgi:AcrR family transcriptional regulator